MRERRDTHLEGNSRKASEDFVHVQYLLRDGLSIANQQRACGSSQSIKLCPSRWGPATFFPDLCERVGQLAGLFVVTFQRLTDRPVGFSPKGVLVMDSGCDKTSTPCYLGPGA